MERVTNLDKEMYPIRMDCALNYWSRYYFSYSDFTLGEIIEEEERF